ncbi:MAG: thioredoxin domain-containing protein [Armatimonadota bacterium]
MQPNHLIHEKSPYLLQHAHNPVEWYPWGEEAFERAVNEDKPIFLSVGYSSCHWCHVMERESFEDPRIADILNRNFICIKVDREERPDIDDVYMTAVQLLSGRGGWPMSVFLTPEGEPFFAGTYYPAEIFAQIARQLADAYRNRREEVLQSAREIAGVIQQITSAQYEQAESEPDPRVVGNYLQQMRQHFDTEHGGFGTAPKFPPNTAFPVLFWLAENLDSEDALQMALRTLDAMALGGIRDHVGGGFHRYSTDAQWLLPHFEKMLPDNAQIGWAYTEAYSLTGNAQYKAAAQEIYEWVLREMRVEGSAFASAIDADSEGEEGKYYTWTIGELRQVLPPPLADLFCNVYSIRPDGNYREEATGQVTGRNIPHLRAPLPQIAEELGMEPAQLQEKMNTARALLLQARLQRVPPLRDDKVLAGWNGLMIESLAYAGLVLEREDYVKAAEESARFILETMSDAEGRLLRRYRDGEARIPAYLEDYALLGAGLVTLFEATENERWLTQARRLAGRMIADFWDDTQRAFVNTADYHDRLIARVKEVHDRSTPCGNGSAARLLARLYRITGEENYRYFVHQTLRSLWAPVQKYPQGSDSLIHALLLIAGDALEEVPEAQTAQPVLQTSGLPVNVEMHIMEGGIMIRFLMERGWHILGAEGVPDNLVPTHIEVSSTLPLVFGEPMFPPADTLQTDQSAQPIPIYRGELRVVVPVIGIGEVTEDTGEIRARITCQPCTNTECALPQTVELVEQVRLQMRA